jgi:hypothetical protein
MAYDSNTKTITRDYRFETADDAESGDIISQSQMDKAFDDVVTDINEMAEDFFADIDAFNAVFLGAATSNPTVDGDGNPVQSGALYVNTAVPELRFYTGSQWVPASQSSVIIDNFVADGTRTVFELGIPPRSEKTLFVHIDGTYQNKDTFSISGNALVFSEAPPNKAVIETMLFSTTSIGQSSAELITNAQGGTVQDFIGRKEGNTKASLSLRSDLEDGKVYTVTDGLNGQDERYRYVSGGVLVPNGGTVLASAMAGNLESLRTVYADYAEFESDPRNFATDTFLNIKEIGASIKALPIVETTGDVQNAGGQRFHVLQSEDGSVPFIAFGPDVTGVVDVSAKLLLAVKAAVRYARSETGTSFAMQSSVDVDLPAGAIFLLSSQVDVPVANLNYNIKCSGGRATLKGAGVKANKGMVFEALRNLTFQNINFLNFSTATEWDTNNIDTSLIRYIDCEWTDCDLGVDTVSYAASRSTVLVFDRPRCGGVLQLVKSFCDMTVINDAHTRNADAAGALIFADSQLIINGGIWTPYVAGASARWVDLDNSQSGALGSRSATFNHARFGPESSGGIPIAYSWLTGNTDGGTRTTLTHITMNECYAGSTNVTTPQGLVVLMDNDAGTNTLAPNTISFNGGSLNAANGFVVTENGSPLLLDIGEFSINIDDAAQTRWGNETVVPSTPIVEAALAKYMSHWRYENFTNTNTGTITISVGFRKRIMLNSAAATTVTDLTDALEGHKVTLQFRNGNTTIQSGSNFQLEGGVDFVGGTWDTLDLVYDRAGARWVETGRSVK